MRTIAQLTTGRGPWRWALMLGVALGATLAFRASLLLAEDAPAAKPVNEPKINDSDRDHWSWLPLKRPEVPVVKRDAWCANDIDRFIIAKLDEAQLSPLPQADPATLLRRVTVDLTGLLPTPAEIAAFESDHSPEAYHHVVDRLLASPAYGERQAAAWLDLARFAETDGFEYDRVRPQAWRYRDWVINAFNQDMPYDEFVRLQLAGDELRPDDRTAAVATGFCLCGPDMPEINLQDERRHFVLNEMTSTVGSVFLGLQVGCAQCHNHKFDPISQADFYRLRAFFEPALKFGDSAAGRTLHETAADAKPSYLWVRGDFRRQGAELQPGFPRIANLTNVQAKLDNPQLPSSGRRMALAAWLTSPDNPMPSRVMANRIWQSHFGRGLAEMSSDFGTMGIDPTHPELLDWLATELIRQGWSMKQMHRLMVTSATYQEASRTTTPGWTDAERHQAETDSAASRQADPENHLLARGVRQRLDAEAIRDCMLIAGDRLSSRRGGRGIMTLLPKELVSTSVSGIWKPSQDTEDHRRRSVYLFVARNTRQPMLEVFDRPDNSASCPRRMASTTAPQALTMLNAPFSLAAARDLAGLVYRQEKTADARISLAYRRTFGREPTAEEIKNANEFLAQRAEDYRQQKRTEADLPLPQPRPAKVDKNEAAAMSLLCLGLFNSNEFLYVD